jgi:hypothetical protein
MELHNGYNHWYNLLRITVSRLLERHPILLVLDMHSYNHRRNGPGSTPDPQIQNPDIILGRSNMTSSFYPWVDRIQAALNGSLVGGQTIDCRTDVKFTGGWMSRWLHHHFPGRVVSLSVEFKKIFMDEWSGNLDNDMQNALTIAFHQAVLNNLIGLTDLRADENLK